QAVIPGVAGMLPAAGDERGLASWSRRYPGAVTSLTQAVTLYGGLDDQPGQASTLNQLGWVQVLTGEYPAAIANYQQALALARGAADRLAEAHALQFLGFAQQMTGDYQASAANLSEALNLYRSLRHRDGEAALFDDLARCQH